MWGNYTAESRAKAGMWSWMQAGPRCGTVPLHWLYCHHISIPHFLHPTPSLCQSHCSSSAHPLHITSHTSLSLSPKPAFFICLLFHFLLFLFSLLGLIYIDLYLFLFLFTVQLGLSNYIHEMFFSNCFYFT